MSKGRKDSEVRFETPPIVWGDPSESLRWAVASAEAKKKSKRWDHKRTEMVDSPRIDITLDTDRRIVRASGLAGLFGKRWIEDSIDIRETVEIILRALSFAKFKNVLELTLDGKLVYSAPDEKKDVHHVIDILHEEIPENGLEEAIIDSALYGKKSSHVHIIIRNRYRADEPPIKINFEGEVELRQFHAFTNYLAKHLEIEESDK